MNAEREVELRHLLTRTAMLEQERQRAEWWLNREALKHCERELDRLHRRYVELAENEDCAPTIA